MLHEVLPSAASLHLKRVIRFTREVDFDRGDRVATEAMIGSCGVERRFTRCRWGGRWGLQGYVVEIDPVEKQPALVEIFRRSAFNELVPLLRSEEEAQAKVSIVEVHGVTIGCDVGTIWGCGTGEEDGERFDVMSDIFGGEGLAEKYSCVVLRESNTWVCHL